MSTAKLIRWSGMASILAGVLYWIGLPGAAEISPVVSHYPGHWLFGLAGLFTLLGLVGMSAYDAGRSGRLGKAGIVIGIIAGALVFIGNSAEAIIHSDSPNSWTSQVYGLGQFGIFIVPLLLGIATLRAKSLPRWSAWTFIVASSTLIALLVIFSITMSATDIDQTTFQTIPSLVALTYLSAIALGAPWLALGYVLWSSKGVTETKST